MKLLHNLPPQKVWIRSKFLTGSQSLGDVANVPPYIEGIWVTCKAMTGRSLLFETLLNEYCAVYDKLPISAFYWRLPEPETEVLELEDLQFWDCFSYDLVLIEKQLLSGMRCQITTRSGNRLWGNYQFTIDQYEDREMGGLQVGLAEIPSEHKSHNVIFLDSGQIWIGPNNKIRWQDSSLTPRITEAKAPSFLRACPESYEVENMPDDPLSLGQEDAYMYDGNHSDGESGFSPGIMEANTLNWVTPEQ